MAGVKISALPAVPSALLTDFFPVVQGGVTSQETLAQVATLFGFSGGILSLAGGGTGADLTAANGAILYSTASALSLLAPGTSGQLFQSGGAGAPNWTTATFPSTAGSSGAVLVSNGTNWSSSTVTGITALGTQAQALNMGTNAINNVTDPVNPQDAATKNYVDTVATGGGAPVVAATTGALTVTYSNGVSGVGATLTNAGAQAAFSIDGQSPTVGQRVLIKNQASSLQNGVYTVTVVGTGATNWVLTRATDYDTVADINGTGLIPVSAGTVNANTGWINTTLMVTVGTTAITYVQFGIGYPVSLANGGTGASLSAVNNAVFVTSSMGVVSLSTTLPSGLTIPGYAGSGANSNITSMTGLTGLIEQPTGIADTSGNKVVGFSYTASSVNYTILFNNSTTGAPGIQATGSDSSVTLALQSKGGIFQLIDYTTTNASTIRLYNAAGNAYSAWQAALYNLMVNALVVV